ncbi:MAG: isopeptide-forming domain-containing fimbrial protein [Eggerthellaceae bacterium]
MPANTKNLKFADTMDSTQTLDASSIKVTVDGTAVAADNYTLTTTDNTIKISFANAYVAGLVNNAKIVVTYDATVNSAALTADPSKNTAKITYGDNDATVTSTTTEVYNAKVTVTKKFEGLTGTLANNDSAQFVLKNADGKYYQNSNNVVTWVDSADNATKLTYTQAGSQDFTGLADGTYTLVESKTPAGYKTAADTTITIDQGTYTQTNLEQAAEITNETGSALPTTGGMGTTLLYIVGAALVIGAGVLLITRRRMQE